MNHQATIYKCIECGAKRTSIKDGELCKVCKCLMIAIGHAKTRAKESMNSYAVGIQVDTTQLDEAIAKANQLVQLLERADALAYRIRKEERLSQKKTTCQRRKKGKKTEKSPPGTLVK